MKIAAGNELGHKAAMSNLGDTEYTYTSRIKKCPILFDPQDVCMAFSEAQAVDMCIAIGYDEVHTFEIGSIIIACEAQETHIQVVSLPTSHVRRMKRFWYVQHVDFCSANMQQYQYTVRSETILHELI